MTRLASLVAHQFNSPVAAAASLVQGLLNEYAGPLSAQQKDLLARANGRIEEALETTARMLALGRPESLRCDEADAPDLSRILHQVEPDYAEEASRRGIVLNVGISMEPAATPVAEDALRECIRCLLTNALKYTPDNGRIQVRLEGGAPGTVRLSVADSGIGVPEASRERVFEPFYRSPSAEDTTLPGSGLGLAFAKSIADAVDGTIGVRTSEQLGGADFILTLPLCRTSGMAAVHASKPQLRVVVVGGVAAGPKAAAKIIRLNPDALVTVVDRGDVLSYAGCGFPYYVSGVVRRQKELLSSPVGMVRDPVFFQNVKNVVVLNRTEALEVDRRGKRVRLRNLLNHDETWASYDKLVLATGAVPVRPSVPGAGLAGIFTLHGVHDAEGIRAVLSGDKARDVVIVGGGLLGVEITQALVSRGCRVTIIEKRPQILAMLDCEMAQLTARHMESHGVRVLTETELIAFDGRDAVQSVRTNRGALAAEMVVIAMGVRPDVTLAERAGLEIGRTGALRVDDRLRTSDPDIFAAGDCVESRHVLTGKPCYIPLGSTANKQGRAAAVNLCGGNERFPGVLGSTVCQVFDYCVGVTGLKEQEARDLGYDPVIALAPAPDREHFLPSARPLAIKLVVDRSTRRLIGCQAIGEGDGAKRIDVAATAILGGMTVDQAANLDLCYAPPFSQAMDHIITGANIVRNKIDGHMRGISPRAVHEKLAQGDAFIFLDVRSSSEYAQIRLPKSTLIPLGALRGRLNELARDREIVTFCSVSLRGYEAGLILNAAGFSNVSVMDGGLYMWPYETIEGVL